MTAICSLPAMSFVSLFTVYPGIRHTTGAIRKASLKTEAHEVTITPGLALMGTMLYLCCVQSYSLQNKENTIPKATSSLNLQCDSTVLRSREVGIREPCWDITDNTISQKKKAGAMPTPKNVSKSGRSVQLNNFSRHRN